ncbi:MAG: TonB-dependent receptor [Bacteroidia bacterium]|nr:TonB-dependent receptor [Bacteroidia bacterium]
MNKIKMNKMKSGALLVAVAMLCSNALRAQITLSGKVTSNQGAVPFAAIVVQHSQINAVSNEEGNYVLKGLKAGRYVLQTKCLGYILRNDTVNVLSDASYDIRLTTSNQQLDEVVVNSTRVDKNNGMAYSNVDAETLKKQNLGQDAPYMLNLLPSVVVNSDAGNGVGYTGIRIRGTDPTRINVTINGVPVNDAESQATFFVNMPDFVSGVNNIQVQRGVGTSGNGAGAFGATINFQTNQLNAKPYAQAISTAGSYDTYRNTLAAGTGLLEGKFALDARASNISSAGYIDRASSKLQSYYLSAGFYGKKSVLKFINFLGQEKTGQAWNYVPEDSVKKGKRTYNSCGEYYDSDGKVHYYKNETDNYKQNNFQLHFIHQFNKRLNLNVTGHFTKGAGYYEQYKAGAMLSDYNMQSVITPKGDTIGSSDLIRRLWLDNNFAGGIFNLNYTANSKLAFTLGGGYNTYFGKHFGRVIWARYASNSEIDHQYGLYTTN